MPTFGKAIFEPFNSRQLTALKRLENRTLKEIDAEFGSGWPTFRSGSRPLAYHCGCHTRTMKRATDLLCNKYGVPPAETAVTNSAASAHDKIQRKARGVMERESGEWYAKEVQKLDEFQPETRHKIGEVGSFLIRGTEPVLKDNVPIDQMCNRLSHASKSAEFLAKILGCGDFAGLNSLLGPYEGHKWFEELGLPWSSIISYQEGQVNLQSTWKMPIRAAEKLFWPRKAKVIEYSTNALKRLKEGRITSLVQLFREDLDFMRKA